MKRRQIMVRGLVQGVGFRPFIHGLATRFRLTGRVANTPDGVRIEVEGPAAALAAFAKALESEAPPLARISGVTISPLPPVGDPLFVIAASQTDGHAPATIIPPDMATCDDCLAEFHDSGDRRYLYPFINCTNCGPRYTIINSLPYDRATTTMRHFTMCPACQAEYDDPTNRRFHAEPNACPTCGPQLSLVDARGGLIEQGLAAAMAAAALLVAGRIVAIKGLGGFHLAVDAGNDQAVRELRRRKGRAEKPLALIVPDLDKAKSLCFLDPEEEPLLTGPERPILLARPRPNRGVSQAIAPGLDRLGLMLPYTPLHHLLFRLGPTVLVMTSGNVSDEPIATGNREAISRLAGLADAFLLHNREISRRNDDSVVIRVADARRFLRRSRGYAPAPILVGESGPPVLAVGGELKNTVCLLTGEHGIVSQHIGDLENLAAYQSFMAVIDQMLATFKATPALIVHDLHPGYLSSRWAGEQPGPRLAVQHHHAHLAACLAEHRETGPAIGLILDGTGYGLDGTIWGGEILVGDCVGFERYGHLWPMPLPGGEAAIREPWRAAVGYLYEAFAGEVPDLPCLASHSSAPILGMLRNKINCPVTSSCGRLFDAVAAMAGGRPRISYEAQAAIEFAALADDSLVPPYPFEITENRSGLLLDTRPLIRAVAADVLTEAPAARISRRFHQTLIRLFTEAASQARRATGLNLVALSGGVFQNRLLLAGLLESLTQSNFQVLTHTLLPANDGCLALGQAVIGRQALAQKNHTANQYSGV